MKSTLIYSNAIALTLDTPVDFDFSSRLSLWGKIGIMGKVFE